MWNELFVNVSGHFAVAALVALLGIILFVSDDEMRPTAGIRTFLVHMVVQIALIIIFWFRDGFLGHLIYLVSILVPFVVVGLALVMTVGDWETREHDDMNENGEYPLGPDPLGDKGPKPTR